MIGRKLPRPPLAITQPIADGADGLDDDGISRVLRDGAVQPEPFSGGGVFSDIGKQVAGDLAERI